MMTHCRALPQSERSACCLFSSLPNERLDEHLIVQPLHDVVAHRRLP